MEWRPSLEPVATGEGGSRLVATRPPLMGVTSPQWVASAAAVVMAAIPVAATGPGVEEERRDARLHASPGGGAHGSPAWSGLEEAGGPAVGDAVAVVEANPSPEMVEAQARAGDLPSRTGSGAMEVVGAEGEQLPASCNIPVVDILSDVEEDTGVAQPGVPPSQERAVILASLGAAAARSSGRSGADRELVWPQPGEPGKARFVLHDGKEQELWGLLEQSGLSVQSDLALTAARLKEALERVKLAHQAVSVDLPRVAEGLETMSVRKSQFLREEHGRLEREAAALQRFDELSRELEAARRESQDRAVLVAGVDEAERRATVAEKRLAAVHARLAETEAAAGERQEALEAERMARAHVEQQASSLEQRALSSEQEVVALRGQLLEAAESVAQLCEKVTQQEHGLAIGENARLELGKKIGLLRQELEQSEKGRRAADAAKEALESDLEAARAAGGRSAEAVAWSLEELTAYEKELNQLRNVAQMVVAEVFGSGLSTSAPAVQLAEIPDEVRALISDSVFYAVSGVLMLVVTHYPDLDFKAICGRYASGWSANEIQKLGQSLVPHAQVVVEQTTAQWVMEARRSVEAASVGQEGVANPVQAVEAGSEPSAVPTALETPSSPPAAPPSDATGGCSNTIQDLTHMEF
ncbi:uncharacterized protein [Setaria viridis]